MLVYSIDLQLIAYHTHKYRVEYNYIELFLLWNIYLLKNLESFNYRNSVRLAIRKVMYAPMKQGDQPSIEVSKEFMMSPNKLHLEASLDKEVSYLKLIKKNCS